MSVKESDTHPAAMTDDKREELRKLVAQDEAEAEGADDDTGGEGGDDGAAGAGAPAGDAGAAAPAPAAARTPRKAAKPAAGAAAGAQDAGGDGEGGEGDDAAGGDGQGDPEGAGAAAGAADAVPRKEFNGVLAELVSTRKELTKLKAATQTTRDPLPPRDFDAEDKALDDEVSALDARYDGEGLADDVYRAELRKIENKRRALDRDRNKYDLHAELAAAQAAGTEAASKVSAEQAAAEWNTAVTDWHSSLGDWAKNPVRRATIESTMQIMNADPELSQLDNAAYLAKLDEYLQEAFPDFPRGGEGGGAPAAAAGQPDNVDPRKRAAAQRAAAASSAPPRVEAGVGNRGTGTEDIDLGRMPIGKWKDIPKAKQNELLGID